MKANESIDIIMGMIEGAKSAYQKISPYFLMWGFMLMLAALGEFLLVYQMKYRSGFLVWPVLGILGAVGSYFISKREDAKSRAKTYHDLIFQYLWGGFGISLFLVIVFSVIKGINPSPYVLLLTGLPTFVSGGLLKSMSLKVGGFVFWIIGSISFFVEDQYTGLLFCVAILLGYIWPGIQLRKTNK